MRNFKRAKVLFVFAGIISATLLGCFASLQNNGDASLQSGEGEAQAAQRTPKQNPIDGKRAHIYLTQLCQLGPRFSGSPGMAKQQEVLQGHFTKLGGKVTLQKFRARHPQTGDAVAMANLIVEWHPDRKERMLLCAHYDTRPYPDRDPDPEQRKGVFVGANDGASGVAVLAELAHLMPKLQSKYGVDFVLFDAEEFVFDDLDPYFLGSEYFARRYVAEPPAHSYRAGVLLDMVGDASLQIYQEKYSVSWRDTRPLVHDIWTVAKDLGVREFIWRRGHKVRDDHLALRNTAKIPTCDIIDFDYPSPSSRKSYWHTTADTPDKCSAESLAKVGWVMHEWLTRLK